MSRPIFMEECRWTIIHRRGCAQRSLKVISELRQLYLTSSNLAELYNNWQTSPNCAKLCWNPTESDMRLVGRLPCKCLKEMNIFFRTKIKYRMIHRKNAEWITAKTPNGLPQKYRIVLWFKQKSLLLRHKKM